MTHPYRHLHHTQSDILRLETNYWDDSPSGSRMAPSGTSLGPSSSFSPANYEPFDQLGHAQASPSAFNQFNGGFAMPRFASGGPGDTFGYGVAVAEPDTSGGRIGQPAYPQQANHSNDFDQHSQRSLNQSFSPHQIYASGAAHSHSFPAAGRPPPVSVASSSRSGSEQTSSGSGSNPPALSSQHSPSYMSNLPNRPNSLSPHSVPVYAPYGSSVLSIKTDGDLSAPYNPPSMAQAKRALESAAPFDPAALGLPVPPPSGESTNFAGLYSSSGFDMLSVLARVASRPNPQINIGPVDTGCSFLVVDAKRFDMPIVYASATFSRLTGYTNEECLGRNCRFLQSPDGVMNQGAARNFTDGSAAWHMREHIGSGKENQTSLINFKKGGQPFINLVTVIPITWDSDEIAYYVGFQVDLVDQPNAILERMKGGTYVVNYSLFDQPPKQLSIQSMEISADDPDEMNWTDETIAPNQTAQPQSSAPQLEPTGAIQTMACIPTSHAKSEAELVEVVGRAGLAGLEHDEDRQSFHKMLLNECSDFVHVLSLKGSLLYCSPSTARILEYDPAELIGKTLPALCHPSDVVPVMRLLKDTSTMANPTVSLLYRIRRRTSGYLWIECSGKLHIEPGKGRKCVIFVGRPKEPLKMSWDELRASGGVGHQEWWTKLSTKGVVLSATSAVQALLGVGPDELVGRSFVEFAPVEAKAELEAAIAQCQTGRSTLVRYKVSTSRGDIELVTRFYSRAAVNEMDTAVDAGVPSHLSILAQTSEASSDQRKLASPFALAAPEHPATDRSPSPPSSDGSEASEPPFSSTFRTLAHPSAASDNVFDELDTTRCTSWQYELHQLQNTNRKLREERDHLVDAGRRRRSSAHTANGGRLSGTKGSAASSKGSSKVGRSCANCGKGEVGEWKTGPTGPRTLCGACGGRWAKAKLVNSGVMEAARASAKEAAGMLADDEGADLA